MVSFYFEPGTVEAETRVGVGWGGASAEQDKQVLEVDGVMFAQQGLCSLPPNWTPKMVQMAGFKRARRQSGTLGG